MPALFLSYAVMWRLIGMIAIFAGPLAGPVGAESLSDGLRAYDAGRYATAAGIWSRLAEAGDVDAQTALAGLYVSAPPGVSYAPEKAAQLYRWAAEQGDAIAWMNLGDFYAKGVGVERDFGRAAFWLRLASEAGYAWASERLRKIAPMMNADDEVTLNRLRADWSDKHRK